MRIIGLYGLSNACAEQELKDWKVYHHTHVYGAPRYKIDSL